MAKTIALDDLIDGIDMQSDDVTAYLDRDTGEVMTVGDEIASLSEQGEWREWERELIEVLRQVEKGSTRYLQLPSKLDTHEWEIMRRFCDTVGDDQIKELLLQAIHGRGAFRRFKDEVGRSGLLNPWFDFKRNALREQAIEWCQDNDIPFK